MINPFVDRNRRLRNGWWILVFFGVLAAFVVPATIYASGWSTTIGFEWQALFVLLATWLCVALRKEPLSSVVGSPRSWAVGMPLGVLLGFGVWILAASVLWITGDASWRVSPDARDAIALGLAECLAVAVTEELIFRGFVFQRLIDGLGIWLAQILIAGYFVLTHWTALSDMESAKLLAVANIFAASLMFGAFYLRTRSLAVPVSLHFMLNYTQGPLLGFGVSGEESVGALIVEIGDAPVWWTGGGFGLEASVPGTVVVALALVGALFWRNPRAVAVASECEGFSTPRRTP